MATAFLALASCPAENSALRLRYDDVTLLADALVFSCGIAAISGLTWWFESEAGEYATGTIPRGTAISTHLFTTALQLVNATDKFGHPTITVPVAMCGLGLGYSGPVAPTAI